MCGIYGFVGVGGEKLDLHRLKKIAVDTQRRGPHAFGFAWIDNEGRLKHFKQTGRISDHLSLLAMAKDARILIGHCRYATHGSPENNLNNHPFACDGGFLVHNGVVSDHNRIAETHDLWLNTDCDSEVLARLIETFKGSVLGRCEQTVNATDDSPLVMLVLWPRPGRVAIVRRGNPLWRSFTRDGAMYFSSCFSELPGKPRMMQDDTSELWSAPGLLKQSAGII